MVWVKTIKGLRPIRGERTSFIPQILAFIVVLIGVGVTFSFLNWLSGFNVIEVVKTLSAGAFGSAADIGQTLIRMSPILLTSLGLIIAFRCGLWNIGAEGQLYLGALGATLIGVYVSGLPAFFHILLAMIVSFLFGGLWAVLSGFFYTKFNANLIITTLLSNFIAIFLSYYVLRFHLQSPTMYSPVSKPVLPTAELPIMAEGTLLHAGILIALAAAIVVWFIIKRTALGYTIVAIGENQAAAAYGGIRVNRIILISMLLSGGLAGIAGMGEVLGVQHLLIRDISPNYGFIAIAAALIARLNPWGTITVSLFFGALLAGGNYLQLIMGVPTPLVGVLVGLFIVFSLLLPIIERRFAIIMQPKLKREGQ